jgi:superoxide dismutase, Fe-Mn family
MTARPIERGTSGQQMVISAIKTGKHMLPVLPYNYGDLEPYIDAETMELHHSKHHQAYVNSLNRAELQLVEARETGDFSAIKAIGRELAFNGAGHANHLVFFQNMRPEGVAKREPEGALLGQIQHDFGDIQRLKDQFSAAALAVEGSGWASLVFDHTTGRLYTMSMNNHQNLTIPGAVPILMLDMWEHAFYLKYQNRKAEYVKNWWNLVDFNDVEERFDKYVRCTI